MFRRCCSTFSKLGLDNKLCNAMKEMGFSKPTDIQSKTIQGVLGGQDVLCTAQTGTGKTLAYLLPVIQKLYMEEERGRLVRKANRPRALVIVPSRELGIQVGKVAKQLAHHIKFASGLVAGGSAKSQQKKMLDTPIDILFATPGRLDVYLKSKNVFLSKVKYIVMDEVDTLYDPRAGFTQALDNIVMPAKASAEKRKDKLQFILAGATMQAPIDKFLFKKFEKLTLVSSGNAHQKPENINEVFVRVGGANDKHQELRRVIGPEEKAIVFCNTMDSVRAADHMLREHGYESTTLHGEIPPTVRAKNFTSFVDNAVNVLVCTDLAARGLDVKDIRHVVLFDFPRTAVEYIHRVGRTGRAGSQGRVTSFIMPYDVQTKSQVVAFSKTQADAGASTSTKLWTKKQRAPKIRLKADERNRPNAHGKLGAFHKKPKSLQRKDSNSRPSKEHKYERKQASKHVHNKHKHVNKHKQASK